MTTEIVTNALSSDLRQKRRVLGWASLAVTVCVAIPLLLAVRLWSFSYFWTDDFGNTFWVQSETGIHLIEYIINPLSRFYRPFGLLFYWMLYRTAGLNPVPYHLVAWALHAINCFLVFSLLRRLLRSPVAAAAGAITFALRVNFADIYFSFGTIFELLACCLMLLGLQLYIRYRPSLQLMLVLTGIYVLAIRSKEMAITLVAIWFIYDWYAGRPFSLRCFVVPFAAAVWFGIQRVQTMKDIDPSQPYYLDLRLPTLVDGIGQYFSWLYGLKLPTALWCAVLIAGFLGLVYFRNRIGLFFLGYTVITFMPVIFLINHRWPYFWYIPFFGIAGLFGLAAKYLVDFFRARLPLRHAVLLNVAGLFLWCSLHSAMEYMRSARTRDYEASMATSFRSFVSGLKSLGSPEHGAVFYFSEMPPHFHPEVLNAAVQVILKRPDVQARFVDSFPADVKWKLAFSDGHLRRFGIEPKDIHR